MSSPAVPSIIDLEMKQRAANALADHSVLLMHAMATNQTPARTRLVMQRYLTGQPQVPIIHPPPILAPPLAAASGSSSFSSSSHRQSGTTSGSGKNKDISMPPPRAGTPKPRTEKDFISTSGSSSVGSGSSALASTSAATATTTGSARSGSSNPATAAPPQSTAATSQDNWNAPTQGVRPLDQLRLWEVDDEFAHTQFQNRLF